MAAGVAYTQALFPQNPNLILLNIGIAGHQHHGIGSLFLADKITDNDTGRRYYPPLTFTPPCPTASLISFAKPQQSYPVNALCDMEASAFYETATRFSTGELIHCLKVVSDNAAFPAKNIDPKQVSALIGEQLPSISSIFDELAKLATCIKPQETSEFNQLVNQYHFSVNEQIQLKKLLSRWCLLNGDTKTDFATATAKNGKDLLVLLSERLDKGEFYL